MKDYYKILGVNKESTQDEIKKAYRKIAKETHPDQNPGNSELEAKFKDAAEAYDILSNPEKKNKYDLKDSSPFGSFGGPFSGFDMNDIFGGRRSTNRRQRRGNNLTVSIPITIEEMITGTKKEFKVYRKAPCNKCSGTGAENGEMERCTVCNGVGSSTKKVHTAFGHVQMEESCYACQGNGKKIKSPCKSCSGTGSIKMEEILSIEIPKGSVSGVSFIMPGKGDYLKDGEPGDVIVIIEEYHHAIYKRDGINLISNKEINFKEACLGTIIEIPNLLGGTYNITVPKGTQPGKIFRLKGKGIPEMGGIMNGDILLRVNVKIPEKLTDDQSKLVEDLYSSIENTK